MSETKEIHRDECPHTAEQRLKGMPGCICHRGKGAQFARLVPFRPPLELVHPADSEHGEEEQEKTGSE